MSTNRSMLAIFKQFSNGDAGDVLKRTTSHASAFRRLSWATRSCHPPVDLHRWRLRLLLGWRERFRKERRLLLEVRCAHVRGRLGRRGTHRCFQMRTHPPCRRRRHGGLLSRRRQDDRAHARWWPARDEGWEKEEHDQFWRKSL